MNTNVHTQTHTHTPNTAHRQHNQPPDLKDLFLFRRHRFARPLKTPEEKAVSIGSQAQRPPLMTEVPSLSAPSYHVPSLSVKLLVNVYSLLLFLHISPRSPFYSLRKPRRRFLFFDVSSLKSRRFYFLLTFVSWFVLNKTTE